MLNLVANGPSGYTINNSLRFRNSASAYLSRTPASASNRTTWTWSVWVKRSNIGQQGFIFAANTSSIGNLQDTLEFESNDTLQYYSVLQGTGVNAQLATTQVFRDPSAWYHIVIAVDTTQATSSNRIKLYVNGSQVTAFSTATYPSQNYVTGMNAAVPNVIGKPNSGTYYDGYMTEVNFIDGQALTPSSFGSTNALTGVWQPAKYTGTYGTNGFYLNFNSIALTSGSNTGLGKDNSGNGNYWNTNNISVTAGTTYDAMTDVPTLTSATVANYAVLSPLIPSGVLPSNGNLYYYNSAATVRITFSTMAVPTSGQWYWEMTASSNTLAMVGIATADTPITADPTTGKSVIYRGQTGGKWVDGTYTASYGAAWSVGDVIGIAFNSSTNQITFYRNNTSQGALSVTSGYEYLAYVECYQSGVDANFGQRPFTYTPPSGYVALNTYNLPSSTIPQGNKVMDATLYTGNGSTQTITNAGSFKPDFVWIKSRSAATDNKLTDFVRGATKALISNTTAAETTDTTGLTAFNTNGFTLGASTVYNNTAATYVAWQWAGTGATVSNTSGTITSTVDANTTAGFSIVSYTGTGANATVGHGLGVAPKMVIVHSRVGVGQWCVYNSALAAGNVLYLDLTNPAEAQPTFFNSGSTTSTTFPVGTVANTNGSGSSIIAYCFAEIAGFSKLGSYTGNGSTDGTFVYTGFLPKFIIIKSSSNAYNWQTYDSARGIYNPDRPVLYPNLSNAEYSVSTNDIDLLANGFKLRGSDAGINGSGATYIYMAFASNPFRNSLAR